MPKLPIISGKEAINKFCKIGYQVIKQKGSHVRLRNPDFSNYKILTVPLHKTLGRGLLNQLIKDARLSVEDFIEL